MWTEHVITSGPDVFTSIDTLAAYPNELIVWSPQIKDERFVIYRVSLTDGTLVDSRIVDDNTINLAGDGKKIGRAYSMTLVDLNGDGNQQLLCNNWEQDSSINGYWLYEVPADLMNGTFVRKNLAMSFPMKWKYTFTEISGPGYPYLFYPDNNTSSRAHILLNGHGNERLWLMTPTGNAADYEY